MATEQKLNAATEYKLGETREYKLNAITGQISRGHET